MACLLCWIGLLVRSKLENGSDPKSTPKSGLETSLPAPLAWWWDPPWLRWLLFLELDLGLGWYTDVFSEL